jgi:hypothetical protein
MESSPPTPNKQIDKFSAGRRVFRRRYKQEKAIQAENNKNQAKHKARNRSCPFQYCYSHGLITPTPG